MGEDIRGCIQKLIDQYEGFASTEDWLVKFDKERGDDYGAGCAKIRAEMFRLVIKDLRELCLFQVVATEPEDEVQTWEN